MVPRAAASSRGIRRNAVALQDFQQRVGVQFLQARIKARPCYRIMDKGRGFDRLALRIPPLSGHVKGWPQKRVDRAEESEVDQESTPHSNKRVNIRRKKGVNQTSPNRCLAVPAAWRH
jgi:hypothetical protein